MLELLSDQEARAVLEFLMTDVGASLVSGAGIVLEHFGTMQAGADYLASEEGQFDLAESIGLKIHNFGNNLYDIGQGLASLKFTPEP